MTTFRRALHQHGGTLRCMARWANVSKPVQLRVMSTMPQFYENELSPALSNTVVTNVFTNPRQPWPTASPLNSYKAATKSTLSLVDFVDAIPATLQMRQELLKQSVLDEDSPEDPVMDLFRNLQLNQNDWAPYAHFDPERLYTRNLIATDDASYTLLLLCWNPACESKIHDHPCDGCWLQVLQGQVNECRYEEHDGTLSCTADETFVEGQVAFINDSIGLHKVANPSQNTPAVSLHLYAPPFQECRVWVEDESDTRAAGNQDSWSVKTSSCSSYYSEYGVVK